MRATFLLLLTAIFLISCTKKAPVVHHCSRFWDGTFNNQHNGEVDIRITRKGNYQIEEVRGGIKSKFKVDWLDSCQYRLTYISGDQPDANHRPVIVQIVEVKENSYKIEGWIEDSRLSIYRSELFKVN